MPAPTFIYILPWLLAAILLIAAEVRDRVSRQDHPQDRTRKPLEIRWISASIFVGGSLIGSILGGLTGSEFRTTWVALYTVSSLVVFIALTRLLGRSPGVTVSAMLSVCAALASFLLVSSVA
ncbi:hypothetical protein ACFCX0_08585 [Streptomyces sp. NPDC056352]|uniref:hypothetical protein n=1 Tax=Streptomyces sp. NPDC056352 TaxID=3345791 RepID=UPI0035DAF476